MRWAIGLLSVVAVIVAVAVLALVVAGGSSATAVADLEVGDCFDFPEPEPEPDSEAGDVAVVQRVDVIDCDEPHQAEVVLVGELNPDGDLDYPPDDALFGLVDQRCLAASQQVEPDFGLLPIAPIEATWNRFGGRFQCLAVVFGGGRTTGSLAIDPDSNAG